MNAVQDATEDSVLLKTAFTTRCPAAPRLQDPTLLEYRALIGGHWVDADSGQRMDVLSPATDARVGSVPSMGVAEVRRAVQAADTAFESWQRLTARERSTVLQRWHDLMLLHIDDLASVLSAEQGKPQTEARSEIQYAAGYVQWYAQEAVRTYGEMIPSPDASKRLLVLKQAVGVVAVITPWNFPAAMIARKLAPAFAAGCTAVVKPAEATPLTALALAVLAERAGLPPGVLNIVTGSPAPIGGELATHPRVRKLSFTGSTAVGKLLAIQSMGTLKKLSLELGGNAPFIVFDDADLEDAVQGALLAKFRNSGQTCVCANRLLVQEGVYDRFAQKLTEAVMALRVAPASDANAQQGPLINSQAVRRVDSLVRDALDQGATLRTGGNVHAAGPHFYQPTVLCDVTPDMRVAREEIFGPVAPLMRFRTERDAISLANATDAGLAAYVYTRDGDRLWRMTEALEVGMVGVNEAGISTEVAPFGGVKESGMGREGSRHGIDDYMEMKYVCMRVNPVLHEA